MNNLRAGSRKCDKVRRERVLEDPKWIFAEHN